MKKRIFILFVMLYIAFVLQAFTPQPFIDNLKTDNQPTTYRYQKWVDETWQDSLVYEYAYFPDSVTTVYKHLNQDSGELVTDGQLTAFKNENGEIYKTVYRTYAAKWINSYRYLYNYDGDIITSSLYQEWISGAWVSVYQGFYQYDENENCTSELWKIFQNGELVNSHIYLYNYNDNNMLLSVTSQYWNENQELLNKYKKNYTYTDTLTTEYIYQEWKNDEWTNIYKYDYQYDEYNHLQRTDLYTWQNNNWQNSLFSQYSYSGDNLLEEIWMYEYEVAIFFYSRNLFEYQNSNAENITFDSFNKLNSFNYPNPFNPTTTITFELPNKSNVKIEIFNIKGQKIRELTDKVYKAGNHKIVWNGRDNHGKAVSSGIYLYKIHYENSVLTKRMIILK